MLLRCRIAGDGFPDVWNDEDRPGTSIDSDLSASYGGGTRRLCGVVKVFSCDEECADVRCGSGGPSAPPDSLDRSISVGADVIDQLDIDTVDLASTVSSSSASFSSITAPLDAMADDLYCKYSFLTISILVFSSTSLTLDVKTP
ncbi:hypothetical protein OGAPHI_005242 [Ogataea philodendri]|uniref:Uncharacterized protein n=1 Tax=Ogataea philodendri TaxID=1378263 RepID=A0A9P8P351_9ASCO|nr:uncharacterized protein OGAPHI_005242 [Ogataea philodendri]KAH3663839.1 hypothetical protein OGAPHI_005242 [Ogataea philodendri]